MRRINLREAVAAQAATVAVAVEMTFQELVAAYLAVNYDGTDLCFRKWGQLFEGRSGWTIAPPEITAGIRAMLSAGYLGFTINRDTSSIGSIYRWARKRHLSPAGFLSPTPGIERFPEAPRVVHLSDEEVRKLLSGSQLLLLSSKRSRLSLRRSSDSA